MKDQCFLAQEKRSGYPVLNSHRAMQYVMRKYPCVRCVKVSFVQTHPWICCREKGMIDTIHTKPFKRRWNWNSHVKTILQKQNYTNGILHEGLFQNQWRLRTFKEQIKHKHTSNNKEETSNSHAKGKTTKKRKRPRTNNNDKRQTTNDK